MKKIILLMVGLLILIAVVSSGCVLSSAVTGTWEAPGISVVLRDDGTGNVLVSTDGASEYANLKWTRVKDPTTEKYEKNMYKITSSQKLSAFPTGNYEISNGGTTLTHEISYGDEFILNKKE